MRRWTRHKTGSALGQARVAGVAAGLFLMLAAPAAAWSEVPAAENGSGPSSASVPGSVVRPATISPDIDPDIVAPDGTGDFTPASFDDLLRAADGYVADALPDTLGKPVLINATVIDPFHVRTPTSALGGFDWNALAKQSLGAPDRLALSINQQFASSTRFTTAISLRHAAGPLDVDIALTGAQSLADPGRMALAYDSKALIAMTAALRIGVTAQGDLGALAAPAPTPRRLAGPVMQLRLLGGRTTISSDAGYDFALNPYGAPVPHRLHAKIDLNAKF